ncbi:type IV pilin protein [Pseudomonas citronellolis]|uniref:type IV pilin protein n=1 Tax=Pseudomonas citronellolis TaxID=53408 RepID=UPI0009ED3F2F|nr:type IV pilin protein [Pseudomonas citronellolis]
MYLPRQACLSAHSSKGFTLLELMVVVAIISILAAVAYPSYTEHVRKARRSDAEASLMELAQFMERYYTANGRYTTSTNTAVALPFAESPKDGSTKYYNLAFSGTPTATSYVLAATPKGAMSGDTCGTLTLSNTGVKGQGSNGTLSQCWRR